MLEASQWPASGHLRQTNCYGPNLFRYKPLRPNLWSDGNSLVSSEIVRRLGALLNSHDLPFSDGETGIVAIVLNPVTALHYPPEREPGHVLPSQTVASSHVPPERQTKIGAYALRLHPLLGKQVERSNHTATRDGRLGWVRGIEKGA